MRPVYQQLAISFSALLHCQKNYCVRSDVEANHAEVINRICKLYLPSGSGFDSGTEFNYEESTEDCLVLCTSFHHMDEHGYYDGWTHHVIKVTPSLAYGFNLEIEGEDRNDIHDYISDVLHNSLAGEGDFDPLIRDVWGRT